MRKVESRNMRPGRHTMASSIVDLLKDLEETVPHGAHSFFQKLWQTEAKACLTETLVASETPSEDQEEAQETLNLLTEGMRLFVTHATAPSWTAMTKTTKQAKIHALQQKPQIAQRSEEWFLQFGRTLTASEFSAILSSTKRRTDLVRSKSHPPTDCISFRHACPTEQLTPTGWGIRFEPVVKQILEHQDRCSIYEPGRLTHATNPYLAASPDGIVEAAEHAEQLGRLVEIKCPYSRKIGGEIPVDYWIQMQIQMEVTDLDECEYVECEFVSPKPGKEVPVDLSGCLLTGTLYLLKEEVPEGQPFVYQYLYGSIGSQTTPPAPKGYCLQETIPWGLKAWHRKVVIRDRIWYAATIPWQTQFWNDVEEARRSGVSPQKEACLISDD